MKKDLLLLVADSDTEMFVATLLRRKHFLNKPIAFDSKRHPQRDSGIVQTGAEVARSLRKRCDKARLIWDHHGSGLDQSHPQDARQKIQDKLNQFGWKNNSIVLVIVPELERWLWHCKPALAQWCQKNEDELQRIIDNNPQKFTEDHHPKELFQYLIRTALRKQVLPDHFAHIAARASIPRLIDACASFRLMVDHLRAWFPESGAPFSIPGVRTPSA